MRSAPTSRCCSIRACAPAPTWCGPWRSARAPALSAAPIFTVSAPAARPAWRAPSRSSARSSTSPWRCAASAGSRTSTAACWPTGRATASGCIFRRDARDGGQSSNLIRSWRAGSAAFARDDSRICRYAGANREPAMFEKPSIADLRHAADQLGMNPSTFYLEAARDIVAPICDAYAALDAFADDRPPVKYPRDGGRRPSAEENPHGAWYIKTAIKGAPSGPLKGYRVALKDNVCLAGVPMMIGAGFLDGSVPDIDATVVTRILDAGGEIAGKAVCEYYCVSGGSHTSATGPVHNPRKRGHTTGGSSSG